MHHTNPAHRLGWRYGRKEPTQRDQNRANPIERYLSNKEERSWKRTPIVPSYDSIGSKVQETDWLLNIHLSVPIAPPGTGGTPGSQNEGRRQETH